MIFDAPNINRFWADLLVEELIRSGVDFFCLAPGSRSTPLVTAVAAHPKARHVMHYDERGTAFFALGYARAAGRPAAWITTSGTAAANGLPAVVEAATDQVPLLLLTADRPPELRETGANQTIDQVGLFGGYVRWQFDLPAPDPALDPAMVLTTVDQAVYRTRRAPRGPVHLNCMFREPLAPEADPGRAGSFAAPGLERWNRQAAPYTAYAATQAAVDAGEAASLAGQLQSAARGIVVAGKLDRAEQGAAVRRVAERLGWPLFPDVGSQLRLGTGAGGPVVAYYDQVLGSTSFRGTHAPDFVLHFGARSTSKRLLQFLGEARPPHYVVVREHPFRFDPGHQASRSIEADIPSFCRMLVSALEGEGRPKAASGAWLQDWQAASGRVEDALCTFFADSDALSEPRAAQIVSRELPRGHGLFLASSMPVRDMDMYGAHDGEAARVAANRGASGIDGTVASAAGFSAGLDAPVTLLIGDLALLYDLNALALIRERPVTVVVLNNHGGGIFSFLPIARHADVFEPFFGTPHDFGFEAAADLFHLDYHRPASAADFAEVYRAACRRPGGTLIEVTTERAENAALHRELLGRAIAAVES